MRLPPPVPLGDGALLCRHPAARAGQRLGARGRVLAAPRWGAGPRRARTAGALDCSTTDPDGRAMNATAPPILEGRNLTKYFWLKQGSGPFARKLPIHAVDNVSVRLDAGKVTALVGESGAGKTTVARLLAQIIRPDKGQVLLEGKPAPSGRPRSYAAKVQMVLQDPFASLNPVHRIRHDLERPLKIHHLANSNAGAAVADLLRRVALKPPELFMAKFPHELSGGQRQRVA